MLKRLIQVTGHRNSCLRCTLSQMTNQTESRIDSNNENFGNEVVQIEPLPFSKDRSALGPLSEDISHVSTYLKPTFNFAAYANKSETIQELVKLGVNFHYIEKKINEAVPFILRLKFNDFKEHILFINHLGVEFEDIGNIITKNPFIFKEKLDDLEIRINYLRFKKFSDEMISRIVTKNPFWLSYSTQDIDSKLGFFQINFNLLGDEVRQVAVAKPQLITYNQEKIKLNMFALKEEMGFSPDGMKQILLMKPALYINGQHRLLKTFDYLHNVMNISHDQILQEPQILACREKRLKERHQFLVKLKRDQFNPKKPNYISLVNMVKDTDGNFATEVAKSSIEEFNMFLKTM